MAVLDYLPKLNRGLGLVLGAHFLHDFSLKCSLFNNVSMNEISMSYLGKEKRYDIEISSIINKA